MFSDEFGDITAQEVINMANNSICREHIKDYIVIGWEGYRCERVNVYSCL